VGRPNRGWRVLAGGGQDRQGEHSGGGFGKRIICQSRVASPSYFSISWTAL